MQKYFTSCLLLLLCLATAAWSQSGTEATVAGLEQKWLQSQKANNPDMVAPLLADKFVMTNTEGKTSDKAAALATAKATKYANVDYSNLKVTAFGNAAIATGVFKATGTGEDGKAFDQNEQFTDTWVKMPGGKWQCVASHSSAIKM